MQLCSDHPYYCIFSGLFSHLQLVLEVMATIVCLNKDYRPTRMFPEMAKLLQVFSPN